MYPKTNYVKEREHPTLILVPWDLKTLIPVRSHPERAIRQSSFIVMVASGGGFTVSEGASLLVSRLQLAYRSPTFAAIPSGTARNGCCSVFILSQIPLRTGGAAAPSLERQVSSVTVALALRREGRPSSLQKVLESPGHKRLQFLQFLSVIPFSPI